MRKGVAADDLAALEAFYGQLAGPPIFVTVTGFTAKAQGAIFEIEKADDWGLSAAAFDLPPSGGLPATTEAQATAEIKLALAILKYARHARGGRIEPAEVSDLLDQAPPLRDPKTVLTEIAAAAAPDAYLRSPHPKHEQFERLRQALLKARGKGEGVTKQAGSERDIQRLLINMERWRWMPEDLGTLYVWNNVPEYILRVVKNGAAITLDHPIPVHMTYFTAMVDKDGKVKSFADIYGLDSRIGKALLGKDVDLPPAPEADEDQAAEPAPSAATSNKRNARNDLAGSMQGLFGE